MYIFVDIGGTNMRTAAAETLTADIESYKKVATPKNPDEAVPKLASAIADCPADQADAVCIGLAGAIDTEAGRIHRSPNLPGWNGLNLKDRLADRIQTDEIFIVNDTALGALGEAHEGAGTDTGVSTYFTVGTGVGGSRVVNGQLDTTTHGFEPGHQVVDIDQFCELEQMPEEGKVPGHLEYFLGGSNVEQKAGKKPPEIKDDALWAEFQDRLVAGLNNVAVMWSPEVIVVGGSMIFRNEFLSFAYLQKQLEKKLTIYPEVPTVQRAVLQDDAGLIGAQVYLRQHK